ncbi:NAD(P)-binding protein [Thozetella sp. PMI_491]|nr:NAD(P)-binding protein [Thozetella sp. PMI_491]
MRAFITGGSGFIGKAVIKELLGAGHAVLGLARSDKAAGELASLGAEVLRGSLHDLNILKQGADASDGVIHLAFVHDFANFEKCCQTDQDAIRAMAEVLAGSNRPLIMTSGTLLLPRGRLSTEDDFYDPSSTTFAARGESEMLAKRLAAEGVRAIVMRVAPVNHGDGDRMFIPTLITTAREKGVSVYVGDGLNRWPAVHYLDTAIAYRLALESAEAGLTYHAVAEEGVKMKDIAEAIGSRLGVPVKSNSEEEARKHFGPFGVAVGADNPTSSKKTREALGWSPRHCSLLDDLRYGKYFEE